MHRKVPRIALDKVRSDSPADRRKAVATFGDALRREGAARILPTEGVAVDPRSLHAVGRELLELLDEYFGLEGRGLSSGLAPEGAADAHDQQRRLLELCVVSGKSSHEIRSDEGWIELSARPGEWIAIPGPALEVLTGGVVLAVESRELGDGYGLPFALAARTDVELHPLPGFS